MTQAIHDSLQVDGDLGSGGTLFAGGHPAGVPDHTIDLLGSTALSMPPVTALVVGGQSVGLANLPGINTVILNPAGTLKAKQSHNTADPAQWDAWAGWVNATAADGDVVALASSVVVGPMPQAGPAATLLGSIHAPTGWPPQQPLALLFVKGQARSVWSMGYPLPTPPFPPGACYAAHIQTTYHRLLSPYCGRVGIGTTEPQANLYVVGDELSTGLFVSKKGGGLALEVQGGETELCGDLVVRGQPGRRIAEFFGGGGDTKLVVADSGNVGIGTADPKAKLHVQGDIVATGDLILQNADCAEEFAVQDREGLEPGTVMVLAEEGSLRRSTNAYDKKVVGVVSGAGGLKPALILDKQAESTNRMPIALMGKVYCKVDARPAAIAVGDLLTTSPTPGHAMKATDPARAFGAIIGKALKPLEQGTGFIPILIALQ
jgi:hypothetical protein